jgi:hypothetical protein
MNSPTSVDQEIPLEALLSEGIASKSIPLDNDFWTGLESKSAQIVERRTASKKTSG